MAETLCVYLKHLNSYELLPQIPVRNSVDTELFMSQQDEFLHPITRISEIKGNISKCEVHF